MRSRVNQVMYHTGPEDVNNVIKGSLSQRSAGKSDKKHSLGGAYKEKIHKSKGRSVRMHDQCSEGIRAPMHEACSDDNDEWTANPSGQLTTTRPYTRRHRQACRERRRGKTATVCLACGTAGREKPNRRDGSTSFADQSTSTRETCPGCRLTIRHQPHTQ